MHEGKRRKLRTLGDLRALLSDAINDVMTGDLDPHRATAVTKLAGQINASLLAEIEVARFQLAQTNTIPALGSLPLNAADAEAPPAPPIIDAKAEPEISASMLPRVAPSTEGAKSVIKSLGDLGTLRNAAPMRSSDTVPVAGEPPAGRSALDQRRAV